MMYSEPFQRNKSNEYETNSSISVRPYIDEQYAELYNNTDLVLSILRFTSRSSLGLWKSSGSIDTRLTGFTQAGFSQTN